MSKERYGSSLKDHLALLDVLFGEGVYMDLCPSGSGVTHVPSEKVHEIVGKSNYSRGEIWDIHRNPQL